MNLDPNHGGDFSIVFVYLLQTSHHSKHTTTLMLTLGGGSSFGTGQKYGLALFSTLQTCCCTFSWNVTFFRRLRNDESLSYKHDGGMFDMFVGDGDDWMDSAVCKRKTTTTIGCWLIGCYYHNIVVITPRYPQIKIVLLDPCRTVALTKENEIKFYSQYHHKGDLLYHLLLHEGLLWTSSITLMETHHKQGT